jgi:hypothetical protein
MTTKELIKPPILNQRKVQLDLFNALLLQRGKRIDLSITDNMSKSVEDVKNEMEGFEANT